MCAVRRKIRSTATPSPVCQRHGVALDRAEIVGTMKRLLACLVLCASLSASAQDDNCAPLSIQQLASDYSALMTEVDSINTRLDSIIDANQNTGDNFFYLNGQQTLNKCHCVHCDETFYRHSDWMFLTSNEVIALSIDAEFTEQCNQCNGTGTYRTNQLVLTLQDSDLNETNTVYQSNVYARLVVPETGLYRVQAKGDLTWHSPNGGCLNMSQSWKIVRIN